MPGNVRPTRKRIVFIGGGMVVFLLIATVLLLPLRILSSFAASSLDSTSATARALSANSNDPFKQFCTAYYHVTPDILGNGPIDKYNDCLSLGPLFHGYLLAHNFASLSTPSSSGAAPTPVNGSDPWPETSLVALEHAGDAAKGNSVPASDVASIEGDLTAYFQSLADSATSQQSSYQDALDNWRSDPLLPLALVTYTLTLSSNQPVFADATDNNPSFTTLTTFLTNDAHEVATIQTDLEPEVKSATYQVNGVDCSFSNSLLTQAYQDCLGTDTLVDLVYAENIGTGNDPTTVYDNVNAGIASEFTGEVGTYLRSHSNTATAAQATYAFIMAMTDQKMKETLIDHVLSDVVKNVGGLVCASLTTVLSVQPSSSCLPTPTSQVSSPETPVVTPTNTPQDEPLPTPTFTLQATQPPSLSNKMGNTTDLPLSVFQMLPTDTHTWYSAPNNDPPGYDSYPHAKGTGTYTDPVTFAIADDSKTFSQGMILYIPEMEKYFIAEDTCAACADDLAQGHQDHIDLWVGDLPSSCADNIQVPPTMYSQSSDPEPIHYLIVSASDTYDQHYTVNQAPFTCGNP